MGTSKMAKRGRKESRALVTRSAQKDNVMTINRQVNKTVKDASGKDFKRTANISFDIPEKMDDLAGLVTTFGSVQKLAEAAFYGVWRKAQLDATNELMKGDKASKALKKMVNSLKAVMPNVTDEAAIKMVLSNPEVAKAFESGPVSAEITMPVNPAADTFTFPALTEAESEEEDADEKTEETTVA